MDLAKSLILNLSLVITLSFISSLIYENFYKNKKLSDFLQLIIFSCLAVYTIHNPVVVANDFNFDGRTVLISISTLFFGWFVGIVTALVSLIARFTYSTVNPYSATAAVLVPYLIGLLFHILVKKKLYKVGFINLLLFGLLNSIVLFLVLYIIRPINNYEYLKIQRIALIIFPIITTLIGLVINSSISKTKLLLKVQESESLWKATFHSIKDGIVIIDLNGKIVNVNNGFKDLFRILDSKALNGKSFNDLLQLKDFETQERLLLNFNKFSEPTKNHNIIDRRVNISFNQKSLPAIIYLMKITDKTEKILGYVFVIRDISKEIEDQEKLVSSEQTFRGVFNSIQEAIYIQDIDGSFIDVNDGAVKMYGYEKQEFIGRTPAFLSAENKNDNLDLVSLLYKAYNGEPQIFEFWGKNKYGKIFPKIVRLYPGEYYGKKVIVAAAIDITNIKIAEEKILEQERLLRILLNVTPDIIYVKDGNGNWLEINKGMLELLGISDEGAIDNENLSAINDFAQLNKNILTDFEKIEEKTWMNRKLTRTELCVKHDNGYKRFFDLITIPLFNDDNSRKNLILIGRDISLRKKDEEEKQIMLNKLSGVVESFDGAVLVENQLGNIEFVNDNFIKLFKVRQTKDKIKSVNRADIFNSLNDSIINSNYFLDAVDDCIKSKSFKSGIEFNTKDDRIIEATYSPILHDGKIVNHLWIFRDITEEKTYEKKLKSQINELERFNKSMVERELRMIELKKEVNDLLLKSGLSPKYTIVE